MPSVCPIDFRLVFRADPADGYEFSRLLLAKAGFEGELQLLTPAWERALGFGRGELRGRTLLNLMWSDSHKAAGAVAAILGRMDTAPVELRVCCRDGRGKDLRLHRRYDRREQMIYIVAEEMAVTTVLAANDEERRAVPRQACSGPSAVA
jgi:PAS domain-containing protein